jgi:hypothetical protein
MKKYKNLASSERIDIPRVREQLSTKNPVKTYLDKYGVVRIGALGDIMIGSNDSYMDMIVLMQTISVHGYKYVVITKSCHSITDFMLELMKVHGGVLNVSCGFYTQTASKKFESAVIVPPEGRRRLIERAIKFGIPTVLRLVPMHPDFMSEHIRMLEWFAGAGGDRVILETLRILGTWKADMPGVDFSKFVPMSKGGVYNGYITPSRKMQDEIMLAAKHAASVCGIEKVTICGDMELNDRIGYRSDEIDCCQLCEILDVKRPPRDWDNDSVTTDEVMA